MSDQCITVFCYGDSNTYGFNPVNGLRYPCSVRWTSRLQQILGDKYIVAEEGYNGRTTVHDDPEEGWRNGLKEIRQRLNIHKPVDVVILMLGTNDLKNFFPGTAREIAEHAGIVVKEIQSFAKEVQEFVPKIILASPLEVGAGITESSFCTQFDETAVTRSREFAKYYREVAKHNGCVFFDAAQVAKASPIDSVHLTQEGHAKLAEAFAEVVKKLTEDYEG